MLRRKLVCPQPNPQGTHPHATFAPATFAQLAHTHGTANSRARFARKARINTPHTHRARLCMCRSVSANTVVVLSPGDDGVYNTDDDLNDGWVLASLMGTQASACAGREVTRLMCVSATKSSSAGRFICMRLSFEL